MGVIILIGLCLYLSISFGFALFTYAFFWYETFNSSHLEYLRQLSKGRVGRWVLRGIVTSFVSQNLTVLFFPLRFWTRLWDPKPDPSCPRPPVILIHGLYHNVSAWILYRRLLMGKGFRNTYAFGYSSLNTNFQELLEKLDQKIQTLAERFPNQHMVLVGHSLGGLLARVYAEDPSNSKKIAAVVTLGAPHQGSKLAAFGAVKLARSLSYRGKLFEELESKGGLSDIPCLAIYSPIDNMVLPNESLHVAHSGWSHLESYPISHVSMLYHRRLAKLVLEYLQIRAFSKPQENAGD